MARPERFELPTPRFVVWLRVIGGSRIARDAPRTLPANVSGTQLGTFSGLFVETRPFCSRDFPFCSLCPLSSAALNAPIYLKKLERAKGIEPSTYSLGSCRSTTELCPRSSKDNANMGWEKQAPQALWRCGVRALRLRRSPTASASVAYACSHGLTEMPPIRICTTVAGFCHGGNHAMILHESTPAQPNTWAVHFPGNLRWTNAMQIVKGMVPYAAVAMDEVERVGRRLKARAAEADLDRVWREEWAAMADRVAAAADTAVAEGRHITAGHHYMRAGNYYYSAERFIPPGADKMAMYRKALRAYHAAMERLYPEIERVEVPYEGTSLPAYFVRGASSGRRPTVVLFDGMDNAKEMSVIFAGLDFAKRGINTLAIDGPGQSEPLRLRNIPTRHDYEAAGIPAYDYVASRPDVDPKRVAVMGYSFGGYHAPRICAFDKRYAACVCFGAMHWNIYDFVAGHAPTDPRKTSASTFQFRWVVGAPDNDTA